MHVQKFTVEELEQQPYEVKKRFSDTVGDEIQKLLDYKYSNCNYDISTTLYETLLEEDYDHESKLWSIKNDSLSLLELMANSAVTNVLQPCQITSCAKMLRTLIDFANSLSEEKAKAELDAIYIKLWGTEKISFTASVKDDYTKKLKLAQYEKELERA